jgi:hypothetical protein
MNNYSLEIDNKQFCNLKSKTKIKIFLQSSRPCNHHTHQEKPKNTKKTRTNHGIWKRFEKNPKNGLGTHYKIKSKHKIYGK